MRQLVLAFDDDGPLPYAHWIGIVCEAFGCVPSQAEAELDRMPVGFLEEVLEYRSIARAKAMYDAAHEQGGAAVQRLPRTRIFDLIRLVDFELGREASEQKQSEHDG